MGDERTRLTGLPVGTITFLLSDIEGSTRAWEAEPDAMASAIARHYELLDEAITSCGGVRPLEQGEGDSVVGAFEQAADAMLAALTAQRWLATEPWPTTDPIRVRMAVHTGEARLRDELNYVGNAIIRTARLRSVGYGGQVLVSDAAKVAASNDLADVVDFLDLGVHRLKDLAQAEHVWQLTHEALPREFPSLRSLVAQAQAEEWGLENVRFEQRDVTSLRASEAFDWILTLDAVHDQAHPDRVLAGIAQALRPDGIYFCVDVSASSHVHENIDHPLGPALYTVSTMHCMTVSLAYEGAGLGAVWGEQTAMAMLADAGFSKVTAEHVEGDPINVTYICRRS